MSNITRLLLYAGSDEESFQSVRKEIIKNNRETTIKVSAAATVLIAFMFISSLLIKGGVSVNRIVYGVGTLASVALLAASLLFSKKYDELVAPLVYAAYIIYYTYGILIGAVTDPKEKTVTFIVVLVFLPMLFIDRPIYSVMITAMAVIVFVTLCVAYKPPGVMSTDIIDTVVFGILGNFAGAISCRRRIGHFLLERELSLIGRKDQLTGMNNQNAYKLDLYGMPSKCKKALACIYIDANGLKHLNDTYGHHKGNEMLVTIAQAIVETFGEELTYRVGGDEFVAFLPDPEYFEVKHKTDEMVRMIEEQGYNAAVGWKIYDLDREISILDLVRDAEKFMYQKKTEFYKNSSVERRG